MAGDSFVSFLLGMEGLTLQSPVPVALARVEGSLGWGVGGVKCGMSHLFVDGWLQVPRTMCEAQSHLGLALESSFSSWVSSSTGAVPGPAWTPARCL